LFLLMSRGPDWSARRAVICLPPSSRG
jgi:hypothetical protein